VAEYPRQFQRVLHEDLRGSFSEFYRENEADLPAMVQVNVLQSHARVLRGMHITLGKGSGKLVGVVRGKIMDVAIDCRPDSPRHGDVWWTWLTKDEMVYVPPGFAHGLQALNECVVVYASTAVYKAENESAIDALDPDLDLPWKYKKRAIRSSSDKAAPRFHQWGEDNEGRVVRIATS
jgi:dTDP-4-dehydrorhamnose 3,5-epimerase